MTLRRSHVLEMIAEKAFFFGGGGISAIALGALLYAFRGDGMLLGLVYILWIGGATSLGLAIFSLFGIRQIVNHDVDCPYCNKTNTLTTAPKEDFTCEHCSLLIPVKDGAVLPVFQVRCGFCNHLVYYNEKSEALICDNCDREIPIHTSGESHRILPKSFTIHDDPNVYALVLVDPGPKTEEMIDVLQKNARVEPPAGQADHDGNADHPFDRNHEQEGGDASNPAAVHEAVAEFEPVEPSPN